MDDIKSGRRLTILELAQEYGHGMDVSALVSELIEEGCGSVPAMCSVGCLVEPDGSCVHGNPSFMLEMGYI